MTFDEKKWAETTIFVQNACNPVAVAQTFASMVLDMGRGGMDHKAIMEHPCFIAYVDKLASMANIQMVWGPNDRACEAHAKVTKLASGPNNG